MEKRHAFDTASELRAGLVEWIGHYNADRPHSALSGRTPDEAYHIAPTSSDPRLPPDQEADINWV
ncbi:integrase core domain-containing protein [Acetobacter conturbans]|uniref:integrase core domain-containing protein n=1 Tax=Acetobacter conturbans TaxID=1737472 RepID=UPI0038D0C24B